MFLNIFVSTLKRQFYALKPYLHSSINFINSSYQHGHQQLRAQKVPHNAGFNHGVYPQQLQQTQFNQNQSNTLLPTNDLIAQNQIMKQNSMHNTYPLQQSASQVSIRELVEILHGFVT